jgi:hypothetical protein
MSTNFARINVLPPAQTTRLEVATPRVYSRTIKVAEARDVDMAQAQDGSLLAWNGGSRKFEAKNTLRNQLVDGGNF